jgi:quercetin dioxygenase-like cupin family protein
MEVTSRFGSTVGFRRIGKIFFALVLLTVLLTGTIDTEAGETSSGITLTPVTTQALPEYPDQTLTAFIVNLAPDARTGSHRHAGIVFVYVLEGTVRSQLNSGELIKYCAGQSWSEPPGTVHSFMENPSKTKSARLLATIIAPTGAQLTTYDK